MSRDNPAENAENNIIKRFNLALKSGILRDLQRALYDAQNLAKDHHQEHENIVAKMLKALDFEAFNSLSEKRNFDSVIFLVEVAKELVKSNPQEHGNILASMLSASNFKVFRTAAQFAEVETVDRLIAAAKELATTNPQEYGNLFASILGSSNFYLFRLSAAKGYLATIERLISEAKELAENNPESHDKFLAEMLSANDFEGLVLAIKFKNLKCVGKLILELKDCRMLRNAAIAGQYNLIGLVPDFENKMLFELLTNLVSNHGNIKAINAICEELGDDFNDVRRKSVIDIIYEGIRISQDNEEKKRLQRIACYFKVNHGMNFIFEDAEINQNFAARVQKFTNLQNKLKHSIEVELKAFANSSDQEDVDKFKYILFKNYHKEENVVACMTQEEMNLEATKIAKNESEKVIADVLENFDQILDLQKGYRSFFTDLKDQNSEQRSNVIGMSAEIRLRVLDNIYSYKTNLGQREDSEIKNLRNELNSIISLSLRSLGITVNLAAINVLMQRDLDKKNMLSDEGDSEKSLALREYYITQRAEAEFDAENNFLEDKKYESAAKRNRGDDAPSASVLGAIPTSFGKSEIGGR